MCIIQAPAADPAGTGEVPTGPCVRTEPNFLVSSDHTEFDSLSLLIPNCDYTLLMVLK